MKKLLFAAIVLMGMIGSADAQVWLNYPPRATGGSSGGSVSLPTSDASDTQVLYVSGTRVTGDPAMTFTPTTSLNIKTPFLGGQIMIGSAGQAGLMQFARGEDGGYSFSQGWNGAASGRQFEFYNNAGGGTIRFRAGGDFTVATMAFDRLTVSQPLYATGSTNIVGANATPSSTLQVGGTGATAGVMISNCSTTISCGAGTAGKLCYRASNATIYQCDGSNSASPLTYGTKVSATTLN